MATNRARLGLKVTGPGLDGIKEALDVLVKTEVLAGFPAETTERDPDPEAKTGITNAALAYIHDNGEPSLNIPARPFMRPALDEVQDRIADKLGQIVRAVVVKQQGVSVVERGYHQIGLIVKLAIQNKITEGIPPPLADATLRARARKRTGRVGPGLELLSRSMGNAPGMDFVTPLIDTGQLRNAANYAIRLRKNRER